jgi:hypothetical protein
MEGKEDMEIEIGACYREPETRQIRRVLDKMPQNRLSVTSLGPGSQSVIWYADDFARTFTERVPDPTPAVVEKPRVPVIDQALLDRLCSIVGEARDLHRNVRQLFADHPRLTTDERRGTLLGSAEALRAGLSITYGGILHAQREARETESDPIALMDNGLAPDGWVEVQRDDNHQDVMPTDDAAAIALAGPLAMLYRVATGEMVQCLDEEACDVLAARVNDTEDGTPALVCIVPRSVAVEKYGEENVPR